MAKVKIVLRSKVNNDGTSPLVLRITKNRKSSFVYLGYNIKRKQWDAKNQRVRKSHANYAQLNNFLLKKLSEANDSAIELEIEKKAITSGNVKQRIKPTVGTGFFAEADLYITNLRKEGKFNRVSAELPRINRFREFLKGADIKFSEITVQLLNNFKAHLLSSRKINERTAINHLSVIRSIFSQTRKGNETVAKHYPFGRGKIIIKFPESVKIGLNPEEVKAIEALDLSKDPPADHARNIWLFSYYFAGMRISDVLRLRWLDFQNDRLYYSMGKNTKAGSLKIPEKAQIILEKYAGRKGKNGLLFPDLHFIEDFDDKYEVQRGINKVLSRINKHLKKVALRSGLQKKLTTHIARHTFGNLSGDKIPVQMLQKLYRHSSIATTIGYQANFIFKDADEALEKVLAI